VLSDRADHASRVADGPLTGRTIAQLVEEYAEQLLGQRTPGWRRFPLLLKFLDARDVLSVQVHPSDRQPDLHLNGYKISNPTVLARVDHDELDQFLRGCGWTPYFVEGDDPDEMHQRMATVLDVVIEAIRRIQHDARHDRQAARPRWPMIVLRSPKGWTGPKVVDGLQIEGTFRAHQVPLLVSGTS